MATALPLSVVKEGPGSGTGPPSGGDVGGDKRRLNSQGFSTG